MGLLNIVQLYYLDEKYIPQGNLMIEPEAEMSSTLTERGFLYL